MPTRPAASTAPDRASSRSRVLMLAICASLNRTGRLGFGAGLAMRFGIGTGTGSAVASGVDSCAVSGTAAAIDAGQLEAGRGGRGRARRAALQLGALAIRQHGQHLRGRIVVAVGGRRPSCQLPGKRDATTLVGAGFGGGAAAGAVVMPTTLVCGSLAGIIMARRDGHRPRCSNMRHRRTVVGCGYTGRGLRRKGRVDVSLGQRSRRPHPHQPWRGTQKSDVFSNANPRSRLPIPSTSLPIKTKDLT